MTNQEFFEIVACFDRSTAQTMKLSTQEFTIELTVRRVCACGQRTCGRSGCRRCSGACAPEQLLLY